VDDADQADVGG